MRILSFLGLLFSLPLCAYINQNNDVQLWTSAYYEQKLSDRVFLELANQYRIGNDMSELYFTYLQGIVSFKPTEGVLVAPGYRQTWQRTATQPWSLSYEPFVETILRKERGGARIELRNRVIYFMREVGANSWLWRGRLRWMRLEGRVRSYVSNEVFIDSRTGVEQDRIALGMFVPFIRHLRGDFYYMLRFRKQDNHWAHQHIVGLGLDLNF